MDLAKVTTLRHLPGCCAKCRGAVDIREWFVDLGRVRSFYGHLYLCDACLRDIINVCGNPAVDAQRKETDRLQQEFDTLKESHDNLTLLLDTLSGLGVNLFDLVDTLATARGIESPKFSRNAELRKGARAIESAYVSGPDDSELSSKSDATPTLTLNFT